MLAIFNLNKVIKREITLLFMDYLFAQGVITAHYQGAVYVSYEAYLLGNIPYEQFLQAYIEELAFVDMEILEGLGVSFARSHMPKYLTAWGCAEIAHHQAQQVRVLMVSPAHDILVRPLAKFLKADYIASEFLSDDQGHFTSAFKSAVPVHSGTLERLLRWQKYCPDYYRREEMKYYGGDKNDEVILNYMGSVVVVNPQPQLEKLALCKKESGWSVVKTA